MLLAERRHDLVLAALAAVFAAPLGIAAATGLRTWALAAVAAAVLAAAVSTWFRRDPVMVVVGLWAFQIVRTPLAAALAPAAGAGALVNQLTDVCLLVVLLTLAWDALRPGAPRRNMRFFLPALGLATFGLLSSYAASAPLEPTLVGLWLGTKFWVLVGVTVAMAWRPGDLDRAVAVILPVGAVAAGLGLLDFATGGAVADALRSNVRVTPLGTYRSDAAQSLYSHPNEYSLAMSLLVAVALARVATRSPAQVREIALLVLFVVAAVVSLRLKAVMCVTAVFGVVTVVALARGQRGAFALLVGGAVTLAVVFASNGDIIQRQLNQYASTQTTARSQLYSTGVRIAERHFPLGVGFGRFGSAPSRDHYSEVYDVYGLSRVWGLSRAFPRFIADTSWPSVMGETGFGGLAVFVCGLLALLALAVRELRGLPPPAAFAPLALLCVLAVLLVDSSGNPNLFSWNAITVVALFAGATHAMRRARHGAVA